MYFDLDKTFRTDGAFKHKLKELINRLTIVDALAKRQSKYTSTYQETLFEIMKLCRGNLAFLTGLCFPHYPESSPLLMSQRSFAIQMFNFQLGGFMCFRGSRQIGKSVAFGARQLMLTNIMRGFHTMYICPRSQQLETYSQKLRELERASVFPKSQSPKDKLRSNLKLKECSNGSSIELAYVYEDANVIRGKTHQEILLDEAQNFEADLEIEVFQVQSAFDNPLTTFAGTSLTTDSFLESKYRAGSQCSWVTKCSHCGQWNLPLPEYGVLRMIQPSGPACAHCERSINFDAGSFVPANRALHDNKRCSFHIPKIINPAVWKSPKKWAEIYEMKLKHGGNRKFFQEVLGIATEEGEREITLKQLKEICVLPAARVLQERARNQGYDYIVSGGDWGGSDHIPEQHIKLSTTVHVMLGVTFDGTCELIHMRRYLGMGYEDIVRDILYHHQLYKGQAFASDHGMGMFYNAHLRYVIPPEKHLIFEYSGPTTAYIAEPQKAHAFNYWTLNKTESISQLYEAVRTKRIRCFPWEVAEEFLTDFMNLYRAPAEASGSGAATVVYRSSASKPNDTLQAVNYAYTLARILRGEPLFNDASLLYRLQQTLFSGGAVDMSGLQGYSG